MSYTWTCLVMATCITYSILSTVWMESFKTKYINENVSDRLYFSIAFIYLITNITVAGVFVYLLNEMR